MSRDPAAEAAGKTGEANSEARMWDIDGAHSSAQFSIRHMMIANVRGQFSKISGSVALDEQDITRSSVEGAVEVASIETREADRDRHLRSGDFFDATKFPNIAFHSTNVANDIAGKLILTGELTIRDVTKPVIFEVNELTPQMKDPSGKLRFGASARARLNRKDFGLTWNKAIEGGGLLVGDQVNLTIEAEFVRRQD